QFELSLARDGREALQEIEQGGEKFYSESRLEDWLARAGGLSCRDAVQGLVSDVRTFVGGAPQSHDLRVLVAQYPG
ncbi:MAG: hypothetical protein ACRD5L_11465, partial [Bryobacteraceae bacterium]